MPLLFSSCGEDADKAEEEETVVLRVNCFNDALPIFKVNGDCQASAIHSDPINARKSTICTCINNGVVVSDPRFSFDGKAILAVKSFSNTFLACY